LTSEYVETARMLSSRVGLEGRTEFHEASALALPFEDASFDAVWTEHAQMNIADKRGFYSEMARVLRPGGKLLFHDVFAGEGGDVVFPVPWAQDASISHLATPSELRKLLEATGLRELHGEDKTEASRVWFRAAAEKIKSGTRPIVGIHLLMGETAPQKLQSMVRNLMEDRVVVLQGVWVR